jgi:hypothetical protein
MDNLWNDPRITLPIGLALGLFTNKVTEYLTRFRSYRTAKKLVGEWTAHNMLDGRHVDRHTPMPGAGPTEIKAQSWWMAWWPDSHVLDVSGADTSDGRHHRGPLVIDSICPRVATRIVLYDAPSDEVSEQRIVISQDLRTLYVFPVSTVATLGPVYPAHALCRKEDLAAQES